MKIMHVVGARPSFVKVAPVAAIMRRFPDVFEQVLVHTGHHYDKVMSAAFCQQLGLPDANEFLTVGGGSHSQQTARVMASFEEAVLRHRPDWIMVAGDVNSTLGSAVVSARFGIKVAHLDPGLRSRTMPDQICRILADHLSDLLITPSLDVSATELNEVPDAGGIRFVGMS
jgi:UDP-N-acetylglucosamine 2-epimerase (non-hydrolysing)